MNRAQALIARFDFVEYGVCRRLNHGTAARPVRLLLCVASRLGDGVAWYLLVVALPLRFGAAALRTSLTMAATGVAGVVLYKWLKGSLVRERPFIRHPAIDPAMPPLDRYSFPSGHTMHAVAFTWLAMCAYPELGWILIPLATLIAISRVALGLHYPSDVLAGGAIGAALAFLAQNLLAPNIVW
jgi:undecaprenyl-diphosphatase